MFIPDNMIFGLALVFYIGAAVIHVLTINRVIPFNYINGGRSESYEAQVKLSQVSLIILIFGFMYIVFGMFFPVFKRSIVFMIISFLLAILWLFGTIMQLIGTKFERYFVSWLNLMGVISHIELALIFFSVE